MLLFKNLIYQLNCSILIVNTRIIIIKRAEKIFKTNNIIISFSKFIFSKTFIFSQKPILSIILSTLINFKFEKNSKNDLKSNEQKSNQSEDAEESDDSNIIIFSKIDISIKVENT